MLSWSAVGRTFVARIAAAAVATLQQGDALPLLGQIREQGALLVVGEYLRPDGNLDDQIVAPRARTVGARSTLATGRAEVLSVAEVDQRIEAGYRLENDVAALAA